MKELLAEKRLLVGTMLSEVFFPNISFILKNAGEDYMIIDCEHGPFDNTQVGALLSMARSNGIQGIVRIPEIRREPIVKYLDMGADGFLIPMVHNAEDAAKVVDFARYQPEGHRGIALSRAHARYAPGDVFEYMASANRHVSLLIQIELTCALEQVREIAAVPGIDALMVGPSDLSMDMGIFNQFDNPVLLSAVEKVAAAAEEAGLASGIITAHQGLIQHCMKAGMRVICEGSEIRVLSKGFAKASADTKKLFADIQ